MDQNQICAVLDITVPTLHRHFRAEIDSAAAKANTQVALSLYKMAMGGNVSAAIFWLKARAKWSERFVIEGEGDPLGFATLIETLEARRVKSELEGVVIPLKVVTGDHE